MKTITITIPEELDAAAAAEAARRGISKSQLIREGLAGVIPQALANVGADLWVDLAGFGEPNIDVEPGEVDRVLYG